LISETLQAVLIGALITGTVAIIIEIFRSIREHKIKEGRQKEIIKLLVTEIDILLKRNLENIGGIQKALENMRRKGVKVSTMWHYPLDIAFYESIIDELGAYELDVLFSVKKFYNNLIEAKDLVDVIKEISIQLKSMDTKTFAFKGLRKDYEDHLEYLLQYLVDAKENGIKAKKSLSKLIDP